MRSVITQCLYLDLICILCPYTCCAFFVIIRVLNVKYIIVYTIEKLLVILSEENDKIASVQVGITADR